MKFYLLTATISFLMSPAASALTPDCSREMILNFEISKAWADLPEDYKHDMCTSAVMNELRAICKRQNPGILGCETKTYESCKDIVNRRTTHELRESDRPNLFYLGCFYRP